jgi:uroporphyrinogen decarboxylase
MDFVKIQYELKFPQIQDFSKPDIWLELPILDEDFFLDQWNITEGLVRSVGEETLIVMTLYSPFMCAGQMVGRDMLVEHIEKYPEAVKNGLDIVANNLLTFTNGCIERGIDGFYHSAQGGEKFRFGHSSFFNDVIKPYDIKLMTEINERCDFNILHICDYHGSYCDYTNYLDYPGDIINCSLTLYKGEISSKEISRMFGRPFMGGMDRHGIINAGSKKQIEDEVVNIIADAPEAFILGANCTLPGDNPWENVKAAISAAHRIERNC